MARISLADSGLQIIMKMSEGNPGAATVLVNLLSEQEVKVSEIDPDNLLGAVGVVLYMDTLEIYGSNIWMFYKDVCGQDYVTMIGLLRAIQLGFMDSQVLTCEFDNPYARLEQSFIDDMMTKVRTRLPNFKK